MTRLVNSIYSNNFLMSMSVLAAISVLAVLIVVHELGHFAAARLQGIRVAQFSIGFGPALLKYQGKETLYALRLFPLGGYVGFPDDEDQDKNQEKYFSLDDPDLMRNRPIWHRAIVISAGVIANLIFAYFLLVVQINVVGIPKVSPGVAIPQIINPQESVAAKAGIEAGDIVLAVNQNTLGSSSESLAQFRDTVQNSPEVPLRITLQRGDKKITLEVTPEKTVEGEGKIGVVLSPNVDVIRSKGILQSLTMAAGAFVNIVLLTVQGFWQLISNFSENIGQVAGPVKIVEYGASIAKDNLSNLYQFAALISINLAIINILPLPALDGGQLLFLVLEGMRGKPLPDEIQNNIMQTGLFLLLGLGVFLIVRDTLTLSVFQ